MRSGSANWRITPSPIRPAVRRALGPYPATQTRGTSPLVQGNFVRTPSSSTVLPAFKLRKMWTNSSRFSSVVGFLPRTRRELSPRPMPSSMRPWEARLRVAKRLAETVTSRTAGLVTQVPRRIFLVLEAMSVRSGNGSFQMTWESKIQPKEKPLDSAWRVRLRIRSIEMSGLMVMPKSMENGPPQPAGCVTGATRFIKAK